MNNELTTELAKNYPALAADQAKVARVIARNAEASGPIRPFSLERIQVGAAGANNFVVIGSDGSKEPLKSFRAIHLSGSRRRQYWPAGQALGGPPACSSPDTIHGVGDNGTGHGRRLCAGCPQSAWGTATSRDGSQGRGQACAEVRWIYLLREGRTGIFPSLLMIPPTSLTAIERHTTHMMDHLIEPEEVYHDYSTEVESTPDGYDVCRVIVRVGDPLPEAVRARADAYRAAIVPHLGGAASWQDVGDGGELPDPTDPDDTDPTDPGDYPDPDEGDLGSDF